MPGEGGLLRQIRNFFVNRLTTFVVLTLPNLGLVNRIPIWLTVLIISRDVGIVLTVAIATATARTAFQGSIVVAVRVSASTAITSVIDDMLS